ncbi:MAG: hypothetical protein KW793_03575, partial [Candidatus Doudnabacteria bacterium]|nr:hypothetical protein [Candidatus Doudnabacteria bacterium]
GTWKDGIYRKRVDSRKHRLRVMDAYGIDAEIVRQLVGIGTKEIRILETDKNIVLSVSFAEFMAKGVSLVLDGEQIFLPVKYFTKEKR